MNCNYFEGKELDLNELISLAFRYGDCNRKVPDEKAMARYENLLTLKEPPMRILFLITKQFNQILQVKELMAKGLDKRGSRMSTFDLIKQTIKDNAVLESVTGENIVKYYNRVFPCIETWMCNNQTVVDRMNILVANNPYLLNCRDIKANTISRLNCSEEINIGEIISLTEDQSRKVWERLKNNTPVRGAKRKMELAVLATTAMAKELHYSQTADFNFYLNAYKCILDELGISLQKKALLDLSPFNLMSAHDYWVNNISKECTKLKSDELFKELSYYDLLCSTMYLAICHTQLPSKNREIDIISQQWRAFLLDCANKFSVRKTADEKEGLKESCYDEFEKNSLEQSIPQVWRGNNELYRDVKYLRQENLYKEIDFKAINKVMREFSGRDLTVLDLGCGDGAVTCSRFGKIRNVSKIIAVDRDSNQIEVAKLKAKEKGIYDKMLFCCLDMNEKDFVFRLKNLMIEHEIGGVDVVFAALSLHNLDNPEGVIGNIIQEVLKSEGYFIVREMDDDTKIYYSKAVTERNYMQESANEYKKIFGFTDRNCARKLYSWLVNKGMCNIEMFYDVIDTCNKNYIEKSDIFNITQGFRKQRAEKYLSLMAVNGKKEEYEESCRRLINANDALLQIFFNPDFWFCFTNYIAIAQKPRDYSSLVTETILTRDVELYIVRHAQCDFFEESRTHVVSSEGKEQIKQLKENLKKIEFDEIYSSESKRAMETAGPVATSHNLKLVSCPELKEIDRGRIVTDERWKIEKEYYERWRQHKTDMEFPEGENGSDVWFRAKYVIDRILDHARKAMQYKERPYRVCIVTHGGAIRSIICGMLGIPQNYRYQFAEVIDNCSVTVLKVRSDYSNNPNTSHPVTLEKLNDTSYLRKEINK